MLLATRRHTHFSGESGASCRPYALQMEDINKQFEDFISYCRKQELTATEIHTICQPLVWQQRYKLLKKWTLLAGSLLTLYLLYNWSESFAWFASAIGRLLLIQVLPFWDWTPLYNTGCLIERPLNGAVEKQLLRLGKSETEASNCVLCENLERIPTASNVTFSYLESVYLERGLPVIVTDSHAPQSINHFLSLLLSDAPDFLKSAPCDVSTNLMLRKFFDIGSVLQKISGATPSEKWFLQVRNCQFSAVKASRLFVTRPYYYPLHLEPFYSSWVVLTNNYLLPEREIYLQGLIFVQQLSGDIDIRLRPKQPCGGICPVVHIRLGAGECLVFSTDLWMLSYVVDSVDGKSTSITTILEIDWRL